MEILVKVNNTPDGFEPKFVVARICDGDLWYWGNFEDEATAYEVAAKLDAVVIPANK